MLYLLYSSVFNTLVCGQISRSGHGSFSMFSPVQVQSFMSDWRSKAPADVNMGLFVFILWTGDLFRVHPSLVRSALRLATAQWDGWRDAVQNATFIFSSLDYVLIWFVYLFGLVLLFKSTINKPDFIVHLAFYCPHCSRLWAHILTFWFDLSEVAFDCDMELWL